MSTYPIYDPDIFDDEGITNPHPHYKAIRDLGPVVHLSCADLPTVGRYEDAVMILRDHAKFSSAESVFIMPEINEVTKGSTISSDPPEATSLRKAVVKPMMPKQLEAVKTRVQDEADGLVDRLLEKGSFDGVKDFAQHLPVSIVSFLVGIPEEGREKMLDWAASAFNTAGPPNALAMSAMEKAMEPFEYFGKITRDDLTPGSFTAQVYEAADRGEITHAQAHQMLVDYTIPSLDTTIAGTSQLLYHLGQNPDIWREIKADPSLIPAAIEEALRIEAPIRLFTRVATEDVDISGSVIKKGQRVIILYGSANRDERYWENPDKFDIHRSNVKRQIAFGFGIHQCAGQHLARLEMTCLMNSLVAKVDQIKVSGGEYALNNAMRMFATLDASFS